jgi:hypothetical protein
MDGTLRSWLPPRQEVILPARDGWTRATVQNLVVHAAMAVPPITVKKGGDCVRVDATIAMQRVAVDGVALWHDYGVLGTVTRALEGLEWNEKLGLRPSAAPTLS